MEEKTVLPGNFSQKRLNTYIENEDSRINTIGDLAYATDHNTLWVNAITLYTTIFTLSMPDSDPSNDFGCGEVYGTQTGDLEPWSAYS